MDMIASHDDPAWDDHQRVAHPGTFNANPLSAVAGATCLEMIAGQPIVERADEMASKLKRGLNETFSKLEVPGHAHGMASLIHLTLKDCDCDREVCTISHREINESGSPAMNLTLKRAMINAGVDIMGRGSFIVSAVHQERDVDRTVAAFEDTLSAMRMEGLV